MFTKYKGINIPENYSGSRFKAPPETETKTHTPSSLGVYGGTKTSISPAFEDALREKSSPKKEETFELFQEPLLEESTGDAPYFEDEESVEEVKERENEQEAPHASRKSTGNGSSRLFSEFGNLFSQISSKIKQDDLIIIAVILLLLSEENEDNYVILPLLLLLLYS